MFLDPGEAKMFGLLQGLRRNRKWYLGVSAAVPLFPVLFIPKKFKSSISALASLSKLSDQHSPGVTGKKAQITRVKLLNAQNDE